MSLGGLGVRECARAYTCLGQTKIKINTRMNFHAVQRQLGSEKGPFRPLHARYVFNETVVVVGNGKYYTRILYADNGTRAILMPFKTPTRPMSTDLWR